MTLTRRTAQVGDLRLAAVETGVPNAPCVVLIHGLGMSTRSFKPLMAELERDFRVVALDLPGCGHSKPLPRRDVSLDRIIELLWQALDQLGVGTTALLGHSLGAQIAARMTVARPSRVHHLFLVAPCPDPTLHSRFQTAARLILDGPREPLGLIRYAMVDYLKARPRRMWAVFRRSVRVIDPKVMQQVSSPTTVLRGSLDRISTDGAVKVLERNIPHITSHLIDDGTHGLPYQSAQQVAEAVRRADGW